MESFPNIYQFTNLVITDGVVVAIALVCLMQYFLTVQRRRQTELELNDSKKQSESYKYEIKGLQFSHHLARLENRILREFLAKGNIREALEILFRRVIPKQTKGVCALFSITDGKQELITFQGEDCLLSTDGIPELLLQETQDEYSIVLEDQELEHSGFLNTISPETVPCVDRIFILSTKLENNLRYVLVSSVLYPPTEGLNQQIELAKRILRGADLRLRQENELIDHQDQLETARIKLDLQNLISTNIQDFLEQLLVVTNSNRGSLYIIENEKKDLRKEPLFKCQHGLESLQHDDNYVKPKDELYLATLGRMSNKDFVTLNHKSLNKINISSSIGQAILLSLKGAADSTIAIACLTKQDAKPYTPKEIALVKWSGDLLAQSVMSSLSQAIVRRKATLDGLTKLANRRTFDERIAQELFLAKSQQKTCSLILIDLDHFKSVNDNYGHPVGDQVLKSTADILRRKTENTRSNDPILVARYGGEELAILLPGIPTAGALRIAETIRQEREAIKENSANKEFSVTMSIGVASFPDQAEEVSGLIKAADKALYNAKMNGRNRVLLAEKVVKSNPASLPAPV